VSGRFVRLNCILVPNTHTSQHYVIVRSVPLPDQGAPLRVQPDLPLPSSSPITAESPFSRLQTKKLRRIDCNNRYCVWSIAHPQPVNNCQPCYCDKVRDATRSPFNLISVRSKLSLHTFSNSTPPPLNHPALTQSPFFSVPPALLYFSSLLLALPALLPFDF
jgi:hypothetical protein